MSANRSLAPERSPSDPGDESTSSATSSRLAEGEAALSETERCCPGGRRAMGERRPGAGDSPSTSILKGDDSGACRAFGSIGSECLLTGAICGGASWPAGAVCRCGLLQEGWRAPREVDPEVEPCETDRAEMSSLRGGGTTACPSRPSLFARYSNAVLANGGRSLSDSLGGTVA
jgi:hypothetical protein